MNDRLYRSRRDRMLAGVAGGLAERWEADPALVRLVWAFLVIFTGGLALLVYIVMAIVVPDEDEVLGSGTNGAEARAAREARRAARGASGSHGGRTGALIVGGGLVVVGAWLLLEQFAPWFDTDLFWPAAFVALGGVILVMAFRQGAEAPATAQPEPQNRVGTSGSSATTDAGARGAAP